MSKLEDVVLYSTAASRPAAGIKGRMHYASDTGAVSRDNGATWDTVPIGGFTNPMTTLDDIIVGGASGAPGRLAKGTDSQVLTIEPSTHHVSWATPAGASLAVQPDAVNDLVMWLKADSLGLADGASVATWTDSSGLSHSPTAAGAAQPTYKTNILNGLAIVRFDGTSDGMRYAAGFALGEFCIFIVCKTTTMGMLYEHSDNAGSNNGSWLYNVTETGKVSRNGTGQNVNIATGWNDNRAGFDLIEHHFQQDTQNIVRNGLSLINPTASGPTSSTNLTTAAQPFNLGARNAGASLFWAGDIAEVIVYSKYPGSANIAGIRAYLKNRYALYV